MKKLTITLCAAALSVAVFGQQPDSSKTEYKSNLQFQNPSISQPKDSQSVYTPEYVPQKQQQTSPIIQQKFQSEPSLQYPKQQSQPGIRLQPLQTNPQIPSQTQPLDLNNNENNNQLNQQVQPSSSQQDSQRPG